MAYTQNDFQKKLAESGLADKFSQWDMDTAMQHPDFGMSILSAKQDYNSAATPEQKLLANERANALRRHYGYYSGGSDGSQYISTGRLPGQIDSKLEEIGSFGSFDYGKAAPSYDNAYAREQQRVLDSIINRPDFSWSKETDPQWSSYKKSYLREGERATADALGQASAASGGRPSSYAVNAAAQAGDYYATKLNDVIPTLYQQAYDRYLKEFQMQQQALDAVNGQEQLDYNRYLTELGQYNADRDFAYNAYTNDYNRLLSQLGAFQGEEDRQYGRYNDSVDRALQLDALTRERQANEQNFYQKVLDTMLQSGASPSQELVARSGYPGEYVQALENLYKQQALSGSGGRSGGKSGGGATGGSQEQGDIYQKLYTSGARTERDAYAALLAMGYNTTQAGKLAGYFSEMVDEGSFGGNGGEVNKVGGGVDWRGIPLEYSPDGTKAQGTGEMMSRDGFQGVKRTLETLLGNGNAARADEVIGSVWGSLDAAQKEAVQELLKKRGYGVEE